MSSTETGLDQLSLGDMVETIDSRVKTAVARARGRAGYVDEEGEYDSDLLADKLLPVVARAVATRTSERAAVCVRRRTLVQHAYPDITGPEGWAEQADPVLAEKLYNQLDGDCWRLMSTGPAGKIQQRLNGEHALVLCQTQVNPDKTHAVYVTRDRGCLLEDLIKPQSANQTKRANREAALMEMLIQRIPEHGSRFHRDLRGGLTRAVNSALAITEAAVEALDGVEDEEIVPEDAD